MEVDDLLKSVEDDDGQSSGEMWDTLRSAAGLPESFELSAIGDPFSAEWRASTPSEISSICQKLFASEPQKQMNALLNIQLGNLKPELVLRFAFTMILLIEYHLRGSWCADQTELETRFARLTQLSDGRRRKALAQKAYVGLVISRRSLFEITSSEGSLKFPERWKAIKPFVLQGGDLWDVFCLYNYDIAPTRSRYLSETAQSLWKLATLAQVEESPDSQ